MPQEKTWVINSGCTKHIVPSIDELDEITDANSNTTMRVANGENMQVQAIGMVTVQVSAHRTAIVNGVRRTIKVHMPLKLTNVYVVDGITVRLFSCRWGYKRDGISTQLDPQLCTKLPTGRRSTSLTRARTTRSLLSRHLTPP